MIFPLAMMKKRHGLSGTALHRVWSTMLARCRNPNSRGWQFYGSRGIRVCERWLSFENFLADMGPRPSPKHSLDRIDNDGNYEPGNVRWATQSEQIGNRRYLRRRWFHVGPKIVAAKKQVPIKRGTAIEWPNMKVPTGRLLAAARHAAGLKQAELARDAGIDQATLSRMEGAGLQTIGGSNRKLQSVLDALRRHGVEVDEDSIRIVKRGRR
jgi:hypothetical protein